MLNLSNETIDKLSRATVDRSFVKGSTHQFYRYPARFSPQFARAFIEEFTDPGDLIVDPFVGGGTTLVEAMRIGRNAVGCDINSLAAFITQVKTTPISENEIELLRVWFDALLQQLFLNKKIARSKKWDTSGYFKNITGKETWRYQSLIQIAVAEAENLQNPQCCDFARCVILRTAQLALDGKKTIPPVSTFRKNLKKNFEAMLDGISTLPSNTKTKIAVLNKSASEIHKQDIFTTTTDRPKLILTSPPYPGVHVLYHRWQVRGRRETPAPYWIANRLDGDGSSYYTLGGRHETGLTKYFENLEKAFSSISKIANEHTLIIQMVAFSKPEWQLPKYLEVMENCGLREISLYNNNAKSSVISDQRLWRDVPNRKWHAQLQTARASSREVVFCHKLA